ncbi:MAG TPA: MerR family transcriptional regulator, partial [Variovorax sp.]|nr:MerR family transcriptional regulator [Variovorax sp.]
PMKRRGNRRYYQHHEVLMIRRIRDLLYDQGFTISGARNKLQELAQSERERRRAMMESAMSDRFEQDDVQVEQEDHGVEGFETTDIDREVWEAAVHESFPMAPATQVATVETVPTSNDGHRQLQWLELRRELFEIRELLASEPGLRRL